MSTIFKLFGAEIVINPIPSSIAEEPKSAPKEPIAGATSIPSSIAEEPKSTPKEPMAGAASFVKKKNTKIPRNRKRPCPNPPTSCVTDMVNKETAELLSGTASTELGLWQSNHNINDPWKFKKRLTESDLGGLSRLLVSRKMVVEEVLPLMDEEMIRKVEDISGLTVEMMDDDTGLLHKNMVFRLWPSCKSYVINGFWAEYSRTRQLQINDEIGLRWDALNPHRFHFCVLRKATGPEATKLLKIRHV